MQKNQCLVAGTSLPVVDVQLGSLDERHVMSLSLWGSWRILIFGLEFA
jgi:hypothetical protein